VTDDVFQREGWILTRQLVAGDSLQALLRATHDLERRASHLERDALVRGVFFEVQSASGMKRQPAVHPGALRKITSPSKGNAAFAKLRRDPRVLSAISACGVHHPRCLIDQINLKLPLVGTGFPYHQDENFLFGEALERVRRWGGVNLVIALDPIDESNGGFEVLGRTHHQLIDHPYDGSTMNHGVFDETHRVVPTLEPGDAILFHPRLAHGSGPNRSTRPRRLITLWYGGSPEPGTRLHI
jgi:phytanoyl-CoA hydroxylase